MARAKLVVYVTTSYHFGREVFLSQPEHSLMTAEDMRRVIGRIAHEVVERNHGATDVLLVGLQRRGVPLANRIAAAIASFERADVPVGALDINLYRDDLTSRPQPLVRPTRLPVPIEGRVAVLVDDVFFTGRTARAALNALMDLGRPTVVQLAVMVDRGHRELPIRPDYVGMNVPTSHDQEIQVRVSEFDEVDEVVLIEHERRVLV